MNVYIVLVLVVLAAMSYGNYVGLWGEIYLLTPASLHKVKRKDGTEGYAFEMQDTALKVICDMIREVGKARNLTMIDVHSAISNCASAFYKDGVHPNHDGARMIAEKICAVLSENNKQEEG